MNLYHDNPKKKHPVLLAYLREDGKYLRAWCPFCVRWHLHGWGFGHRVAHCHIEDSPFKKTGYVLKAADRKVAQRAKEAEAELAAQNR
jgi:hypothetical protein